MSKQTQTPILPNSVSNRVSSLPGVRVSDSRQVGAVGDGGVEEVDLAVPRHLVALPVEDEAGVVELLPVQLGEGAAYHPDVVGAGGVRKSLPDRAAGGLGVGAEILMLIGTAEHLRQYRQVCPRPAAAAICATASATFWALSSTVRIWIRAVFMSIASFLTAKG